MVCISHFLRADDKSLNKTDKFPVFITCILVKYSKINRETKN